jgi:class 3 adenylate cyclase
MEPREQRLVIILADISGYTRFMVANQLSAIHGQLVITTLIETLLREVDIPLRLQEIEGDAVFLYAAHSGDEREWQDVLAQVRTKLIRFFDVFVEAMVTAAESTPCGCAVCSHVSELALKIVVHSGRAVFHTIGGRPQVSGPDVILAHRLLKNSVPSNEYLLMSDDAYRELGREMAFTFVEGEERDDDFGLVKTHVHPMGEAFEAARASLYAMEPAALRSRARQYVLWMSLGQVSAAFEQLRRPILQVAWLRRACYALGVALLTPAVVVAGLLTIPRKLLARRAAPSR